MTIEYKVNSLSDRLEDARIEKYTLDYKFQQKNAANKQLYNIIELIEKQ